MTLDRVGLHGLFNSSATRYLLIGCANTLVQLALFGLGLKLGLPYLAALTVSWAVAVIQSYLSNRRWTFRSDGAIQRQLPRFFAVAAMTYALNAVMLHGFMQVHWNPMAAQFVCLIATTVTGFWGHRLWSFRG